MGVARQLDLLVLAFALPLFVAAELPLLGFAVAAGAWLVTRALQLVVDRRVAVALADGDRREAMGWLAGATLGRVWLIALAVLLVGLHDRDDGLAAAVLSAALFTVHLGTRFLARLLESEETA